MGLVLYNGCYIFADYDLMAVHPSNAAGDWLAVGDLPPKGSDEAYEAAGSLKQLCKEVEDALNALFGKKLIQHGAEFIWNKGMGAKDSELVLWFGPGNRISTSISAMKKGPKESML